MQLHCIPFALHSPCSLFSVECVFFFQNAMPSFIAVPSLTICFFIVFCMSLYSHTRMRSTTIIYSLHTQYAFSEYTYSLQTHEKKCVSGNCTFIDQSEGMRVKKKFISSERLHASCSLNAQHRIASNCIVNNRRRHRRTFTKNESIIILNSAC